MKKKARTKINRLINAMSTLASRLKTRKPNQKELSTIRLKIYGDNAEWHRQDQMTMERVLSGGERVIQSRFIHACSLME